MTDRISVFVRAFDPISEAGIISQLRYRPEIRLVDDKDETPTVSLVVVDQVDDQAIRTIRSMQRNGRPRTLIVASQLDGNDLLKAVEAGSCGLVRRCDATPERLVAAVRGAAAGDGTVPPDLLGRLLEQVGRLQRQALTPRGVTLTGFADRELQVLRMVAAGNSTSEIAQQLAYSERTVKNVLRDINTRLHLRNRAQAVAYAVREGLV